MKTRALIERLEALGYSFVTVVDETPIGASLTAVEPTGYQVEIEMQEGLVLDRKVGAATWDIMFIGGESYL